MTRSLRDAAQAALDAWDLEHDRWMTCMADAIEPLRAALAEPEPTQEQTPVAWMSTWITDAGTTLTVVGLSPDEVRHLVSNTNPVFPLFAHAAPAQTPMSEDALHRIARAAVLTCKWRQAQPELELLVRELREQGMLE